MTALPSMRVALWQDATPQGGISAALERIEAAVREAQSHDVQMLVFPECFLTGYFRPAGDVPCRPC